MVSPCDMGKITVVQITLFSMNEMAGVGYVIFPVILSFVII